MEGGGGRRKGGRGGGLTGATARAGGADGCGTARPGRWRWALPFEKEAHVQHGHGGRGGGGRRVLLWVVEGPLGGQSKPSPLTAPRLVDETVRRAAAHRAGRPSGGGRRAGPPNPATTGGAAARPTREAASAHHPPSAASARGQDDDTKPPPVHTTRADVRQRHHPPPLACYPGGLSNHAGASPTVRTSRTDHHHHPPHYQARRHKNKGGKAEDGGVHPPHHHPTSTSFLRKRALLGLGLDDEDEFRRHLVLGADEVRKLVRAGALDFHRVPVVGRLGGYRADKDRNGRRGGGGDPTRERHTNAWTLAPQHETSGDGACTLVMAAPSWQHSTVPKHGSRV